MQADIFIRKTTSFVLWNVTNTSVIPSLVIGQLKEGTPISLINIHEFPLQKDADHDDLWSIDATTCNLADGTVYHYWFKLKDSHPLRTGAMIHITDPFASIVDWRLLADKPVDDVYKDADKYPAAVIKYRAGKLVTCDIGGEEKIIDNDNNPAALSPNNRLVIYELPTAWTRIFKAGGVIEIGVGSFSDTTALVDSESDGNNFADLAVLQQSSAYLLNLGINAIELLPPADSFYQREWGYGTTNFFAPDSDLGDGENYSWPAPNRDLITLVEACQKNHIRFFADFVMAFAKQSPYLAAATEDFFILDVEVKTGDPDAMSSRGDLRNGFGSDLFRYTLSKEMYDPISGRRVMINPARQLMKSAAIRWMNDYHVGGFRLDSIENVANWDFIMEFKDLTNELWHSRFPGNTDRFLVVGEELAEPMALLSQNRLQGLWHERFKILVRSAIRGVTADGEPGFESTVRKAIDCRLSGYTDLSQAIIYLTSHDVGGAGNERMFNYLINNKIFQTANRIKLAFACLLTAVGIPMILAGEEFADLNDLVNSSGDADQQTGKQVDPVNFSRAADPWRKELKDYVTRLIHLRTTSDALSVNDTDFIHVDLDNGKRVLVWQRGVVGSGDLVVVVANFSDFGTPDPGNPTSSYIVHNWPLARDGQVWKEITQDRTVPLEWVGREPIFPWEAKVYRLTGL